MSPPVLFGSAPLANACLTCSTSPLRHFINRSRLDLWMLAISGWKTLLLFDMCIVCVWNSLSRRGQLSAWEASSTDLLLTLLSALCKRTPKPTFPEKAANSTQLPPRHTSHSECQIMCCVRPGVLANPIQAQDSRFFVRCVMSSCGGSAMVQCW